MCAGSFYLSSKDFTCISDESVFVRNENVGPAGGRGGQGQPTHLSRAVPGGGGGGGGGITMQHQLQHDQSMYRYERNKNKSTRYPGTNLHQLSVTLNQDIVPM